MKVVSIKNVWIEFWPARKSYCITLTPEAMGIFKKNGHVLFKFIKTKEAIMGRMPLVAQIVYSQSGRPGFDPWVGKIPWRRRWQLTPVFLPGKSHGWRSLAGSQRVRHDWATNTFIFSDILVKAMVFPVVMYGCESWTVKKAERRRIDAFELWCWRRLLRVPWTARRSEYLIDSSLSWRKSVLNIHWKDWCWSWNSNTLATSCEELTHWKRLWCWKGLGAGGEGDDRGWDGWMASLTRWTWVWVNSGMEREAWCAAVHGVTKSQTRLSDSTELNWGCMYSKKLSTLCDFRHRGVLEHMILS